MPSLVVPHGVKGHYQNVLGRRGHNDMLGFDLSVLWMRLYACRRVLVEQNVG